jgi:hypothetical protein
MKPRNRRAREGRGRGARTEQREADREERLAPETVARAPGREEEPGEDDRVGVDDPLELALARVEVSHESRKGDVEDGVVDPHDKQAHAEHGEGDPPAPVDEGGVRHGHLSSSLAPTGNPSALLGRTCSR